MNKNCGKTQTFWITFYILFYLFKKNLNKKHPPINFFEKVSIHLKIWSSNSTNTAYFFYFLKNFLFIPIFIKRNNNTKITFVMLLYYAVVYVLGQLKAFFLLLILREIEDSSADLFSGIITYSVNFPLKNFSKNMQVNFF